MITLAFVEDSRIYRNSLLDIIELTKDMECIGDFTAAEPCLKQLESAEMAPPDVLLLDLNLPRQTHILRASRMLAALGNASRVLPTHHVRTIRPVGLLSIASSG